MSSIRRFCTIDNCDRPRCGNGLCGMHYQRWRKWGDAEIVHSPIKHGLRFTSEYRSWNNMKSRCYNLRDKSYERYGARGIRVCDRWLDSFANFYEDMGPKPSPKHSVDRIDGDGDYTPKNCRWANDFEQNWNKKKTKRNTSGYIGIRKHRRKWVANLWHKSEAGINTQWYLGSYYTQEEAAIAYDIAAIFIRGDEAVTNIL